MSSPPPPPRYGTPNLPMLRSWMGLPPERDGPFWALNLMKYRAVADYQDGRESAITGREADDAYAPLGPLAAIGAMVAFHADVERQGSGQPRWDRIGVVRYPGRRAFLQMQQRDDFQRQHAHKDAGMERTIVMSCLPDPSTAPVATTVGGTMVLRVARLASGGALAGVAGAQRVATFAVEGVIVGDERSWSAVAFDLAPDPAVVDALLAGSAGAEEVVSMALARGIDRLAASMDADPSVGG